MKRLENTDKHNRFVSEMQRACAGTAWQVDIYQGWEEDSIQIQVSHTQEAIRQQYENRGPHLYAPDIYFEENVFGKAGWSFKIQTTSYGSLCISEIEEFTAAYQTAVVLVKRLTAIIGTYYGA